MALSLKEKLLYHQYYFWRHDLLAGLLTHFIPPIAATLLVLRYADLESRKHSSAGAYLRRHMTGAIQAIRFIADLAMIAGAWLHQPLLIGAAALVIVAAWSAGFLRKA